MTRVNAVTRQDMLRSSSSMKILQKSVPILCIQPIRHTKKISEDQFKQHIFQIRSENPLVITLSRAKMFRCVGYGKAAGGWLQTLFNSHNGHISFVSIIMQH